MSVIPVPRTPMELLYLDSSQPQTPKTAKTKPTTQNTRIRYRWKLLNTETCRIQNGSSSHMELEEFVTRNTMRRSYVRWILLIVQLIIGAALTALGPMSLEKGTPITILGASNTVLAGLLALFTHSGLPDRYRYDKAEFERVEDHIREILITGLVHAGKTANEALAECYDRFHHAKTTVEVNVPAAYIPSQGVPPGQRMHQPKTPTQGKDPKDSITPTKSKTSLDKEPITPHQTQSRNTTPKEETEEKGPVTKIGE
ncbi:hypothetical protein FSHL1_010532 [Fusarium sambucinum]